MDAKRTEVLISEFAEKQIGKLPRAIKERLLYWMNDLNIYGVRRVRMRPGYHDEPLKGERRGQRSVRLNRSYGAIYIETKEGIEIVVIEVNKHEY